MKTISGGSTAVVDTAAGAPSTKVKQWQQEFDNYLTIIRRAKGAGGTEI